MGKTLRLPLALLVELLLAGCGGATSGASGPAPGDVDLGGLAGIDTSSFTPREKHELAQYVAEFPAPCPEVAVSIAQCVISKRQCAPCLPAAKAIAQAQPDVLRPE